MIEFIFSLKAFIVLVFTHRTWGMSSFALGLVVIFSLLIVNFIYRTIKDAKFYFSREDEKRLLNQWESIELLDESPHAITPNYAHGGTARIDENEPYRIACIQDDNKLIKGDALEHLVVRIYSILGYESHRISDLIAMGKIQVASTTQDGGGDVLAITPPDLNQLPLIPGVEPLMRESFPNQSAFNDAVLARHRSYYGSPEAFQEALEKTRKRVLIQCKAYAPDKNLGKEAVQEITTAKALFKADEIAVITTAEDYTPTAKEIAQANNCALLARKDLVDLIKTANGYLDSISKKDAS